MSAQIIEKVRKLLALARDGRGNEQEMQRALEIAMRLMAEHGITEAQLDEEQSAARHSANLYEYSKRYHQLLAHAAGKLYGCVPVFDPKLEAVRYTGRPLNLEATEMTYAFLVEQVEALYKAHLPRGLSKKDRGEYRRTFKDACAMRVLNRAIELVSDQQATLPGRNALVVYVNTLEDEANSILQDAKERTQNVVIRITSGAVTGFVAADAVHLRKPID